MGPATLRELALGVAWGLEEYEDWEMDEASYRFWAAKIWVDATGRFIRGIDIFEASERFKEKYGQRPVMLVVK